MTTLPHSDEGRIPLPSVSGSVTLLERLKALHPQSIDLSLGRIERLLAALDHPERSLPPVVHVAGTNGKGSLIAFVRAIAEALGKRVHVYISPLLVNFHERILLAGPDGAAPITEDSLVDCLARAEALGYDLRPFRDRAQMTAPINADTVLVGPGERYDIILRCDNPGRWMIHDHIDHHTMNGHTPHGGVMTVIEYEGIPRDQSYYHWAHKEFVPDFYYEETLRKPHGAHPNPRFKGETVA